MNERIINVENRLSIKKKSLLETNLKAGHKGIL